MSQDTVDLIRGVYDGDFRAGAELFDPLVLFIMRPESPDAGSYLRIDRVADYMRGWLEAWPSTSVESGTEAGLPPSPRRGEGNPLARARRTGSARR